MAVFKILFLFVACHLVHSKPLLFKEMHMKRNFEFSLKPIKFHPITFIKEKWSPLGHVGAKHAIVKRSPFEVSPIVMPVKNDHEETSLFRVNLEKSPDVPVSPPLPPQIENELVPHTYKQVPTASRPGLMIGHPVPEILEPPSQHGLFSTVSVPPISSRIPLRSEEKEGHNLSSLPSEIHEVLIKPTSPVPPLPPVTPGPVPGPLPPPSVALIKPPPVEISAIGGPGTVPGLAPPPPAGIREFNVPPQGGLLTDIARADQINSYLKAVDGLPLIKPPLEENSLPGNSIEAEGPKESGLTGSLVKGSRMALYFGNILLQVMSEVINSARSAISQYSKPATI